MRNIAICLHAGLPNQRNEITNFFSNNNWPYWHWIDDFWIVQVPYEFTPHSLHDKLEELPSVGTSTILLFEFNGAITYWGRANEEAWKWLSVIGNAG